MPAALLENMLRDFWDPRPSPNHAKIGPIGKSPIMGNQMRGLLWSALGMFMGDKSKRKHQFGQWPNNLGGTPKNNKL